jgi:hypothetical protein
MFSRKLLTDTSYELLVSGITLLENCPSVIEYPEKHVAVKIVTRQPCGKHMAIFAASLPHGCRAAISRQRFSPVRN